MRAFFLQFVSAYVCIWAGLASAKPQAAALFCESFPNSPSCSGKAISCSYCHEAVPPLLNSFGRELRQNLGDSGHSFPTDTASLRRLIEELGASDSDGDGITTTEEIAAGTLPGDKLSLPMADACGKAGLNLQNKHYKLCSYDYDYAYKKVWWDVCGEPPSFEEFDKFRNKAESQKADALEKQFKACLDSAHWIGKDGVVWEIGHAKIRPVGSVKLGEDAGILPIVDYYADFNLFVYTQIDGHDARDQLLASYTVTRSQQGGRTVYQRQSPARLIDGQVMQPERRVGLLTTFWNLGFYLNYTGIARVLVAQAFQAYLGISLVEMQGLNPPSEDLSKFRDYDSKGVTRPECAVCHTTVDALAYPFRNYNGLTGTSQVLAGQNANGLQSVASLGTEENLVPLSYSLPRMEYLDQQYPGIREMPEVGYIMGQRVSNLREWATVLVNSDAFAAQTVRDYWKVLVGHEPRPAEAQQFEKLWRDFKGKHGYNVEAMLLDLIRTEAYGAP